MEPPRRKPNRLPSVDYDGAGTYFITICTKDRESLFWLVGAANGRPPLTDAGQIVESAILAIPAHYPSVTVDHYAVMPNHVHLLLSIHMMEDGRPMAAPTISRIMQQFKGSVTKQAGFPLWQKSFHDHVIRDQADYLTRWQYIDTNPARWAEDEYHL